MKAEGDKEEASFRSSMKENPAAEGSCSSVKYPVQQSIPIERRRIQLLDADSNVGFQAALEIKEEMDGLIGISATYQSFLSLVPILLSVLSRRTRPNPNAESIEAKYRKTILEILVRLPQNDLFRPHVSHVLITVTDVLKNDYEEIGLVASRMVFELHKNYRPNLADFVQPFLDFMTNCYRMLPANTIRNFDFTLASSASLNLQSTLPNFTAVSLSSAMTREPSQKIQPAPTETVSALQDLMVVENLSSEKDALLPQVALQQTESGEQIGMQKASSPAQMFVATTKIDVVDHLKKPYVTQMPAPASAQPITDVSAFSSGLPTENLPLVGNLPMADAAAPNHILCSVKSASSFLVLTECPLIAILIFQQYTKVIPSNISTLLPLMVDALGIRPPAQPVPGSSPSANHVKQQQQFYKSRTRELVACQVKTLSFLTYLLRGFEDQMKRFEDRICTNVVSLLATCPIDSVATRRELLIAVRHLLATSFRKGFYKHTDTLLDDRVLAGGRFSIMHRRNNISEYYTTILGPLNYSTLADFVHHARSRLTLHQHGRVIHIFSRVIHDASLPAMIQTIAVRLLLNLVDVIFHSKEVNACSLGRDLLVRILFTLVMKLGTLRDYIVIVAKNQAVEMGDGNDGTIQTSSLTLEERLLRQGKHHPSAIVMSPGGGIGGGLSCGIGGGNPEQKDSIADLQALLTSLISGLKSLIWCINNCQALPPTRQPLQEEAKDSTTSGRSGEDESKNRITSEEREILSRGVEWGMQCLKVLKSSVTTAGLSHFNRKSPNPGECKASNNQAGPANLGMSKKQDSGSDEYREIIDKFAESLSVLDGNNLRMLLVPLIPSIVADTDVDKDLLLFFRHFLLSSKSASSHVCGILVEYLMSQLSCLSPQPANTIAKSGVSEKCTHLTPAKVFVGTGGDEKCTTETIANRHASTILALFKTVLQSVSIYPENEIVLRPHLQKIITDSLNFAGQRMIWPGNSYIFLRLLFRTVSVGKFEESYKEVLPLLPAILNGLYRIYRSTENDGLRCAVVELCLTIPARLSTLLPHLPLLLRITLYSLQSPNSNLVTLGLRTLEFWLDNLNPDFLYPILSQNSCLLTELMSILCSHLNPAPYPFGLIALRILGKLGGKNRKFLREPANISSHVTDGTPILNLVCQWSSYTVNTSFEPDSGSVSKRSDISSVNIIEKHHGCSEDDNICPFTIPMDESVNSAIAILRRLAYFSSIRPHTGGTGEFDFTLKQDGINENKMESVDLVDVSLAVISGADEQLVQSAFILLRSVLAPLVETGMKDVAESHGSHSAPSDCASSFDNNSVGILFRGVLKGFFYATLHQNLKDEALRILKGVSLHAILMVFKYSDRIVRIDAGGKDIFTDTASDPCENPHPASKDSCKLNSTYSPMQSIASTIKLKPLKPFGSFRWVGLHDFIDPFVVCYSLVDILCEENDELHVIVLHIVDYIVEMLHKICERVETENSPRFDKLGAGTPIVENLLCLLCQSCHSKPWNHRIGLFSAIPRLCQVMGKEWAHKYQDYIMYAALFSLKDSPREIPSAGRSSLIFCIKMFTLLYGAPKKSIHVTIEDPFLVRDSFDLITKDHAEEKFSASENTVSDLEAAANTSHGDESPAVLSPSVLLMLVAEINSTKNILRFGSRHCLQQYALVTGCNLEDLLIESVPVIRKALFSRSLRTLPLPEQVAVIQALAFIIDRAPSLFPLMDQDVLALLSELLKMTAIADGVMAAKEGENFPLVDKDGCVACNHLSECTEPLPKHTSAIFFADEYTLRPNETGGFQVDVPPDLPNGVQLRVTTLILFRAVVRRHSDIFFDAPSSNAIGNIRPHVISLFFRSLVSDPLQAVAASHLALKDVLALGINSASTDSDSQQKQSLSHRLPKELLQTCIRPVLLNLRDHTKLSLPLLRGLSRLLSLLATWFNKTLGEKLLEHLRRWENLDKIKGAGSWNAGEEPLIAASIISLFELLPQASIFVEPLVTIVIQLESGARQSPCTCSYSPYRTPLVRYFNRNPSAAADYFLAGNRLTDPAVSEIFQDILMRADSIALRSYFSGQECTRKILSLCFEKPLAIIRSEKSASSSNSSKVTRSADEILSQHGIPQTSHIGIGRHGTLLGIEAEPSKKKIAALHQAEKRAKEYLQAALEKSKMDNLSESQAAVENAKKQHQLARQAYEKAQKEANAAAHKGKLSETSSSSSNLPITIARMTEDALELQHQGFKIILALMKHNPTYLSEIHHADIVRTFRWLWHSKGRHLRLLHEELLPVRYQMESKMISAVLIHYAKVRPSDADILFDLLRIFLEQTSVDFSDIKRFLEEMVSSVLTSDDKKKVLHRFFSILESDRPEETKVLSIHYLVFPMLHSHFVSCAGTISPMDADTTKVLFRDEFVDKEMMDRLVTETISQGSKCGERLQIELLRLLTLLIEYRWEELKEHSKPLLKFIWDRLKSDESSSKQWAYVNVCTYISKYETPSQLILLVYFALLKAYQQESKDLIKEAIGILMPSLSARLTEKEFDKCIRDTSKVMIDEGHGTPQLIHMLQIIVHNPDVFFSHRRHFIQLMIRSLSRLGLSPNCSAESKALSLSLCDLILNWGKTGHDQNTNVYPVTVNAEELDVHLTNRNDVNLDKYCGPSDPKKSKSANNVAGHDIKGHATQGAGPDQNMNNEVANFLIRLALSTADAKEEHNLTLGNRALILLEDAIRLFGADVCSDISPFENLFSACVESASCSFPLNERNGTKTLNNKIIGKTLREGESEQCCDAEVKNDTSEKEVSKVSEHQLRIFLQIVTMIIEAAQHDHNFVEKAAGNFGALLSQSFNFAIKDGGEPMRVYMQAFLTAIFISEGQQGICQAKLFVERHMHYCGKLALQNPQTDFSGLFIIQSINEAFQKGKYGVVESLTGVLLEVAEILTQVEVPSDKKNGASKKRFATPIIGILEEASIQRENFDQRKKEFISSQQGVQDYKSAAALIICIRLLANSSVPYTFSPKRAQFFSVMSTIIDRSSNILILMTCVAVVGNWLTDKCGCPMTPHEKFSFISKMTSLDSRGLSDSAAQPLFELIATTVLSIHRMHVAKVGVTTLSDKSLERVIGIGSLDKKAKDNGHFSQDFLLRRALTSALMCANSKIRLSAMRVFGHGTVSTEENKQKVPYNSLSSEYRGKSSPINAEVLGRRPIDILWQLLHNDWESLGGRYWIAVFVDMFIATSDHSGGVRLMRNKARGSNRNEIPRSPIGKLDQVTEHDYCCVFVTRTAEYPEKPSICKIDLAALDPGYELFRESLAAELDKEGTGLARCLLALRELSYADVHLCDNLFRSLMRSAWLNCESDCTRLSLVQALESLLARPYHSQFLQIGNSFCNRNLTSSRPYITNSIRTLLAAVVGLRPIPLIDVELLLSLAAHFNTWHEVVFLVESYLSETTSEKDGANEKRFLLSSLKVCYETLGEIDMSLSVSRQYTELPSTIRALSLETYGRVDAALALYESLFSQGESNVSILTVSDREMSLWEERWIELNKDLCHWDVLADYANSTNSTTLLLESAWKSRDWEALRKLCFAPSDATSLKADDPTQKIYEIYLNIADGKFSAVENLYQQTGQLYLLNWQLLPTTMSSCESKKVLLQCFQRLVELQESSQILIEAASHSKNQTLPDLKNILSAWRERVPNDYDTIVVWDDLFTWRSHVFSAILSNFQWSDNRFLAALHDRPWTSIQIARVARKQAKRNVALVSLSKLTDCDMDVEDAFSKLREQIMLSLDSKSQDELRGGLNLVNTTNLSFFDHAQKSELFRLKASFLNSLGARAKSNQAYCQSLQICPSHAKSWLSWGSLCSNLAELTERQETTSPAPGSDTSKVSSAHKKAVQYYAQSMGCYFEAIHCNPHNWSLMNIPRCLWMLRKDGKSPGLICQTFETRSRLLPEWIWLPWIPQLLSSLGRVEGYIISKILRGLLALYPQALYFGLRAYYLERRDVERGHRSTESNNQHDFPSVSHAEDLMSSLRRAQPQLWSSLEAVLEELIIRFRPSLEEELLSTINALLIRGMHQLESIGRPDSSSQNSKNENKILEVTNFSKKTLAKIAAKFFRSSTFVRPEGVSSDGHARAIEFAAKYRTLFERDFLFKETAENKEESSTGKGSSAQHEDEDELTNSVNSLTLDQIVSRLQEWQRLLEQSITKVSTSVPLQELSPILTAFSNEPPDLWEGACDSRGSHEYSSKVADAVKSSSPPTSAVAAWAAASAAAASVAAQAAFEGVGGYFGGGATAIEIPGQYAPYSTNTFDARPLPELNAKLIRFEPTVEILRAADDGQLVRRITMIGSDGEKYSFLLQFNGSYFTRVDEHCAQLHYLTEKVLRKGLLSSRKNLGIKPNVVIPIAQRLRLIADHAGNFSLSSVISSELSSRGLPKDAVQTFFKEESKRLQNEDRKFFDEPDLLLTAKSRSVTCNSDISLKVYEKICSDLMGERVLVEHVNLALQNIESIFAFRRRFALEWAVESLLQYVFNVADRTPSRLVVNINNGKVIPTEFRISYNNQGLVAGNKIPFRMTRNLETLMGPFMIDGIFVPAMASTAEAFACAEKALHPAFCVIFRDDIVAWYCSKSPPKSDTKNQELERQLGERIIKNASLVQQRLLECAPDKNTNIDNLEVADSHVRKLLKVATSPADLCQTPLTFQPWF